MPAHCNKNDIQGERVSHGSELTVAHVRGNDLVDTLPKRIAQRDKVPDARLVMVRWRVERLREIAMWIGRCTAYANQLP